MLKNFRQKQDTVLLFNFSRKKITSTAKTADVYPDYPKKKPTLNSRSHVCENRKFNSCPTSGPLSVGDLHTATNLIYFILIAFFHTHSSSPNLTSPDNRPIKTSTRHNDINKRKRRFPGSLARLTNLNLAQSPGVDIEKLT